MDIEGRRMTLATQAVLRRLIEDPTAECYGLELSAAMGLPSGTVHPILARLETLEWVDIDWENVDPQMTGRPRRRYYRVNERGLSCARVALADACAHRSRTMGRLRPPGRDIMNAPPPGFIRTPTPVAAALIAMSVLPLPRGSRDRWSDEYRAEIFDLSRTRQILEAASALSGSFALRSALNADPEGAPAPTTSRSCRIGRHRYQTINEDNAENRKYRYRECVNCGKLKEGQTADFPRTERPFVGGGGIVN